MNKFVLLIIIAFSLAFPAKKHNDTITVNLSTLEKASKKGVTILAFDNGRNIRIVRDSLSADDIWGMKEEEENPVNTSALGFNINGDHFIRKDLAVKFGDSVPEVAYEPYWGRHKMTEIGDYYVFHAGKGEAGKHAYCFYVLDRKLPRALALIPNEVSDLFSINWASIFNDKHGDSFFYSGPVEFK